MGQNITYNEKELGLATRKAIRIMVHTYMSVNIINNLSHHKSYEQITTWHHFSFIISLLVYSWILANHTFMLKVVVQESNFICICTKYEDLPSYLDGKIWHYWMFYRNTTIKCVN